MKYCFLVRFSTLILTYGRIWLCLKIGNNEVPTNGIDACKISVILGLILATIARIERECPYACFERLWSLCTSLKNLLK